MEENATTPAQNAAPRLAVARHKGALLLGRLPDSDSGEATGSASKSDSEVAAGFASKSDDDTLPLLSFKRLASYVTREQRQAAKPVAGCAPQVRAPQVRGGIRDLFGQIRERHHAYAAMHTGAGRSAARIHRNFTVAILAVTLLAALATNTMQELVDPLWTTLVSNAALALIAGLTAINNFLGYQKRAEQHRSSRMAHLRAASLIDVAIACEEEARAADPSVHYDHTSVLEDIQGIHDSLKENAIEIPGWVAKKYPEYEAPWLLRENPKKGSSDSDATLVNLSGSG